MMNTHINQLQKDLSPYREQLIKHPVYAAVSSPEDLRIFMQHHIYAVWDFMSLLKVLQQELTCVQVPWFPAGSGNTRYLINEIVAGEESDTDENGERLSHYEMYLRAMGQCGADTAEHEHFIQVLKASGELETAFNAAGTPESVREFVRSTFEVIASGQAHVQAAVFTFGREDLIPDLFHEIIKDLDQKFPGQFSKFNYYLERHIEVDGGHHSHLALDMTAELCQNDPARYQEATAAAITALQKRLALWDGIQEQISGSDK